MAEKDKIYIRHILNVLDMQTELNSLDKSDKDYCAKQWEIIEKCAVTTPYVKSCLEKELIW